MERNDLEKVIVQNVQAKAAWVAPKAVEVDIEAITKAGAGASGDGVTTTS